MVSIKGNLFLSYCKLFVEIYGSVFKKSLGENLNFAWAPCTCCKLEEKPEWRHQAWKAVHAGNPKVNLFHNSYNSVCENSQAWKCFQTFHYDWGYKDNKLQFVAFHYYATMLLQNMKCNTYNKKCHNFVGPSSCKFSWAKMKQFRLPIARNCQVPSCHTCKHYHCESIIYTILTQA